MSGLGYGLIGNPLGHSRSPDIHAMFGNPDYRLIPLEKEAVAPFLRAREFAGLNVTIPYKEEVIPHLDRISPLAGRIGAVNTVVNQNGVLVGYNTDYEGFASLLKRRHIYIKGKKVVILGSGGASKTVQTVVRDFGAREVVVVSRSGKDNYENLSRHRDAEILVNATPVGMFPDTDGIPVHPADFPALEGVVDLICNPLRTRLLLEAEQCGIRCASGLYMLVTQAAAAHTLFFGERIPRGKIEEVTRALAMRQANLVLVGMPGCGKTSIGRRLSGLTGRPLSDTDQLCAALAGKEPAEVIRQEGVPAFRALETEALRSVALKSGQVIPTGGGIVTRPENLPVLRMNSFVVFLNRPLRSLSTYNRPLSSSPAALKALYAERAELYRAVCDCEIRDEREATRFFTQVPHRILHLFEKKEFY